MSRNSNTTQDKLNLEEEAAQAAAERQAANNPASTSSAPKAKIDVESAKSAQDTTDLNNFIFGQLVSRDVSLENIGNLNENIQSFLRKTTEAKEQDTLTAQSLYSILLKYISAMENLSVPYVFEAGAKSSHNNASPQEIFADNKELLEAKLSKNIKDKIIYRHNLDQLQKALDDKNDTKIKALAILIFTSPNANSDPIVDLLEYGNLNLIIDSIDDDGAKISLIGQICSFATDHKPSTKQLKALLKINFVTLVKTLESAIGSRKKAYNDVTAPLHEAEKKIRDDLTAELRSIKSTITVLREHIETQAKKNKTSRSLLTLLSPAKKKSEDEELQKMQLDLEELLKKEKEVKGTMSQNVAKAKKSRVNVGNVQQLWRETRQKEEKIESNASDALQNLTENFGESIQNFITKAITNLANLTNEDVQELISLIEAYDSNAANTFVSLLQQLPVTGCHYELLECLIKKAATAKNKKIELRYIQSEEASGKGKNTSVVDKILTISENLPDQKRKVILEALLTFLNAQKTEAQKITLVKLIPGSQKKKTPLKIAIEAQIALVTEALGNIEKNSGDAALGNTLLGSSSSSSFPRSPTATDLKGAASTANRFATAAKKVLGPDTINIADVRPTLNADNLNSASAIHQAHQNIQKDHFIKMVNNSEIEIFDGQLIINTSQDLKLLIKLIKDLALIGKSMKKFNQAIDERCELAMAQLLLTNKASAKEIKEARKKFLDDQGGRFEDNLELGNNLNDAELALNLLFLNTNPSLISSDDKIKLLIESCEYPYHKIKMLSKINGDSPITSRVGDEILKKSMLHIFVNAKKEQVYELALQGVQLILIADAGCGTIEALLEAIINSHVIQKISSAEKLLLLNELSISKPDAIELPSFKHLLGELLEKISPYEIQPLIDSAFTQKDQQSSLEQLTRKLIFAKTLLEVIAASKRHLNTAEPLLNAYIKSLTEGKEALEKADKEKRVESLSKTLSELKDLTNKTIAPEPTSEKMKIQGVIRLRNTLASIKLDNYNGNNRKLVSPTLMTALVDIVDKSIDKMGEAGFRHEEGRYRFATMEELSKRFPEITTSKERVSRYIKNIKKVYSKNLSEGGRTAMDKTLKIDYLIDNMTLLNAQVTISGVNRAIKTLFDSARGGLYEDSDNDLLKEAEKSLPSMVNGVLVHMNEEESVPAILRGYYSELDMILNQIIKEREGSDATERAAIEKVDEDLQSGQVRGPANTTPASSASASSVSSASSAASSASASAQQDRKYSANRPLTLAEQEEYNLKQALEASLSASSTDADGVVNQQDKKGWVRPSPQEEAAIIEFQQRNGGEKQKDRKDSGQGGTKSNGAWQDSLTQEQLTKMKEVEGLRPENQGYGSEDYYTITGRPRSAPSTARTETSAPARLDPNSKGKTNAR